MSRVVQLVNSGIEHRPRHRHSGRIVTLVHEPVTGIVEITACVGVVSSVGACQYPLQEPSHHHLGNRFQPYQARGLTGKRRALEQSSDWLKGSTAATRLWNVADSSASTSSL
jgi:hypothetical protein